MQKSKATRTVLLFCVIKEVCMPKAKDPGREIRAQTERVALLGLKRLEEILTDPDTSNADVIKGLSLLFERIYQRDAADSGMLGDFEIRLKA